MLSIKRYSGEYKEAWNNFNKKSKNYLFMFDRDYMDYHKDRFKDHSLMFYSDNEMIAILPMNERNGILYSHGGLTYGGFISNEKMRQQIMLECFSALLAYARENNITKIVYKVIPHIFHSLCAEEDRFALYANNAKLVTVDASTYLKLNNFKMNSLRKRCISKASKSGIIVRQLDELSAYEDYVDLLNEILSKKHNTKAVHTAEELKMLHDAFPERIHLYGAFKDNIMIAGTVVYEYDNVVHTQYLAANEEARQIGGLDLVISTVIEEYKNTKEWLDFGISTEHGRVYLNEGLISQKEGFGGRTGVYEIWEMEM